MDTKNVTRFEIIDHLPCNNCEGTGVHNSPTDSAGGQSISFYGPCKECDGSGVRGREVVFHDKYTQVDVELQDDGRTLKVFLHLRYEETDDVRTPVSTS